MQLVYARDVKQVARAQTVVSIDRGIAKQFNWLAFVWKAIRTSSEAVIGFASNVLEMGAKDFLAGTLRDDPVRVQGAIEQFGKYQAAHADAKSSLKSVMFFNGLLGGFQDLNDYELFCDGYSDLSKQADRYRKKYGADDFSSIVGAMTAEVARSDYLRVPLRSGPRTASGVPRTRQWVSCPNRLVVALMARCDEALKSLPARLPDGMDAGALVAQITAVSKQIRKLGIHNVSYPCGYLADGNWTTEQRRTALGTLDDEYTVLGDLEDCFTEKLNVQTWETVQGGIGWPALWLSCYRPVESQKLWKLEQNIELAASLEEGSAGGGAFSRAQAHRGDERSGSEDAAGREGKAFAPLSGDGRRVGLRTKSIPFLRRKACLRA